MTNDHETDATLELLSLEKSPYSRRVQWALHILGMTYESSLYAPIAGELPLRWRLGRWKPWDRVTVPVGFVSSSSNQRELQLEDGLSIVEWADDVMARRSKADDSTTPSPSPRLVPPTMRREVVQYCKMADEILDFGRGVFMQASWENPSLLREFVGEDPPDAALPVIVTISGIFMRCKYRSTLRTTLPEIRTTLDSLEKAIVEKQKKAETSKKQGQLVYLVGNSLTLADLYVAVGICEGPHSKMSPTRAEATARLSFDMEEVYPVLHAWAIEVCEQHNVPPECLK